MPSSSPKRPRRDYRTILEVEAIAADVARLPPFPLMPSPAAKSARRPRPHPRHRVREIPRHDGTICAWSIYPEQLAPMQRRVARLVLMALRLRGAEEELAQRLAPALARVALRAIGLPIR